MKSVNGASFTSIKLIFASTENVTVIISRGNLTFAQSIYSIYRYSSPKNLNLKMYSKALLGQD